MIDELREALSLSGQLRQALKRVAAGTKDRSQVRLLIAIDRLDDIARAVQHAMLDYEPAPEGRCGKPIRDKDTACARQKGHAYPCMTGDEIEPGLCDKMLGTNTRNPFAIEPDRCTKSARHDGPCGDG